MARKPTLFVDTNVFSSLHYRGGNVFNLTRKMRTEDWWEKERPSFDLWTSKVVEDELSRGRYSWQEAALREVRKIRFVAIRSTTTTIAIELMGSQIVPESQRGDAMHLACAIAEGIDWMLTWNYSHLANSDVVRRLEEISSKHKWRLPQLVSPDSIPWTTLGHSIKRT